MQSVEVPTPAGAVNLKVPAGTSSGQKLRLTGRGLPRPRGGAGDLYAVAQIVVAPQPTERERELYSSLKEVSGFDPRKNFRKVPEHGERSPVAGRTPGGWPRLSWWRFSGLTREELIELVQGGAIPVHEVHGTHYTFSARVISVARTACRLRDELELDIAGLGVALRLLDRVRGLEEEIARLRALLPRS